MFTDKKIVIIGFGKSGYAAAKVLAGYGAHVILNEVKELELHDNRVKELKALGVQIISGKMELGLIQKGIDFIIKNPGIPYTQGQVARALSLGIPVYTEIELARKLNNNPLISITGTNGKTTTIMLTYEILKHNQTPVRIAGNIGYPLIEEIEKAVNHEIIVNEVSSFQLAGIDTFKSDIACLLNISPAHLDYHGSIESYIAEKKKIFKNQTQKDMAILNWDDSECRKLEHEIEGTLYWFSKNEEVPQGLYLENGMIVYKTKSEHKALFPINILALPGEHNKENALAAMLIALLNKVDVQTIEKVISTFSGVAHRLQFLTSKKGVRYYNDSKATNEEATIVALRSFNHPIIHIAGGLDRGSTFEKLVKEYEKGNVKKAIFYGQSKERLQKAAKKGIEVENIHIVNTLEEALKNVQTITQADDIVLFSPACASWDMYKNFEERGEHFIGLVELLE